MVLDAPAKLRPAGSSRPCARPGPGPGAGQGLRRLPDRPPRGRRRAAAPKLPLIPGHEIVGEVVACGPARPVRRPARRHALARPHLRRLPLLPRRPGEPVRRAGLHRLHARRRLRRGSPSPTPPTASRCPTATATRGRPAPVRRPDRLPHAAHGRATRGASASGASAPRRTSWPRSPATRAASSTPSPAPATRPPRPSPAMGAAWAGAGRTSRRPPPLDAALIFAPVGSLVPRRSPPSARAAPWSAAAST